MEKLNAYLTRNKLTAAEFSRVSGVSPVMLSLYLSGKRKPGLRLALAIEKATDGKVPANCWLVRAA